MHDRIVSVVFGYLLFNAASFSLDAADNSEIDPGSPHNCSLASTPSTGPSSDNIINMAGRKVNLKFRVPAAEEENFPEWSWDHVRPWVAIRRADDYSDAQIRALAKQDIVMLEKMNGHKTHGSIEKGTLAAAKRIKAINPKVKILFYLNSMCHYGGYDANETWNDDWKMMDKTGDAPFKWRDRLLSYDHTNPDFVKWWIQRALDMLEHDEIDGIFIDAICKVEARWLPVKQSKAYWKTAMELKSKMPKGKLLIGNALRAGNIPDGNMKHLEYLDGSYLEGWQHKDPKKLAKTLNLMAEATKNGKIIMLNAGPQGFDESSIKTIKSEAERYSEVGKPEYIGFPLGFFLLVVGKYSYFSYRVGVDGAPSRDSPRGKAIFDNTRWEAITRKLGEPIGGFVKDGNVYTREFEYVKVEVDIGEMTGTITVKAGVDETTGEKDDEHEEAHEDEAERDYSSDEDVIEISDNDEHDGSGDEL